MHTFMRNPSDRYMQSTCFGFVGMYFKAQSLLFNINFYPLVGPITFCILFSTYKWAIVTTNVTLCDGRRTSVCVRALESNSLLCRWRLERHENAARVAAIVTMNDCYGGIKFCFFIALQMIWTTHQLRTDGMKVNHIEPFNDPSSVGLKFSVEANTQEALQDVGWTTLQRIV